MLIKVSLTTAALGREQRDHRASLEQGACDEGQHRGLALADIGYSALADSAASCCHAACPQKKIAEVCRKAAAGGNKTLLLAVSPAALWERGIFLGILNRKVKRCELSLPPPPFFNVLFFPPITCSCKLGGRVSIFLPCIFSTCFQIHHAWELFLLDGSWLSLSLYFPNPLPLHSHWEAA